MDENKFIQKLYTVRDMMRILGVSRPTIYTYMQDYGLPSLRVGRSRRFQPTEVNAWIKKMKDNQKGKAANS